jgi:hypothetical protein
MNETLESLLEELKEAREHMQLVNLYGDAFDRAAAADALHDVGVRINRFRANNAKE